MVLNIIRSLEDGGGKLQPYVLKEFGVGAIIAIQLDEKGGLTYLVPPGFRFERYEYPLDDEGIEDSTQPPLRSVFIKEDESKLFG